MNKKLMVMSYTFATLAGVCLIEGLTILSLGRGPKKHGEYQKVGINA